MNLTGYHIRHEGYFDTPFLGHHGWTKETFARVFATRKAAIELTRIMEAHDDSKAGRLSVEPHWTS